MCIRDRCTIEFEKLPCIQDVEILRNILYAGVWKKFDKKAGERKETQGKEIKMETKEGSIEWFQIHIVCLGFPPMHLTRKLKRHTALWAESIIPVSYTHLHRFFFSIAFTVWPPALKLCINKIHRSVAFSISSENEDNEKNGIVYTPAQRQREGGKPSMDGYPAFLQMSGKAHDKDAGPKNYIVFQIQAKGKEALICEAWQVKACKNGRCV